VHRTGIAPRKDLPDPMSDQSTASPPAASTAQRADGPGALRIVGLAAVGIGLAALAGAAFVLSYGGVHAFAVQAGISGRLARGYPLIFDVLLIVILAAVLALRGAGLPSKVLAWACLLALLSAAAGADALHAAGRKLPAREAAVTAAVVPWVLVLIAFVLLLAMLRQARLRRLAENRAAGPSVNGHSQAAAGWEPHQPPPASRLPLVPGFRADEPPAAAATEPRAASGPAGPPPVVPPLTGSTLAVPPLAVPPPAAPPLVVPRQVTAESAADTAGLPGRDHQATVDAGETELAIDAELAPDDPSSDETPAGPTADGAAGQADPGPGPGPDPGPGPGPGPDPAGRDAMSQDQAGGDGAAEEDSGGPDDSGSDYASGQDSGSDDSEPGQATDPEMPVFHRMWSSPVPPAGE
jgi:Protein of unknown function (DUF2637)